jgi:hypothetical protein
MRGWVPTLVVILAGATLGCGRGHEAANPGHPKLIVSFAAKPLASRDLLALDDATMRFDHVHALGDTPPSRPPMGPPPTHPLDRVDFDALSAGGQLTFDVPQGFYSLVELNVEDVVVDGKWRNVPFHARLATAQGLRLDLPAAGQEALPEEEITFTVTVDPNAWFANDVLDGATPAPGTTEIFCDDLNNVSVAGTLTTQLRASFSVQ